MLSCASKRHFLFLFVSNCFCIERELRNEERLKERKIKKKPNWKVFQGQYIFLCLMPSVDSREHKIITNFNFIIPANAVYLLPDVDALQKSAKRRLPKDCASVVKRKASKFGAAKENEQWKALKCGPANKLQQKADEKSDQKEIEKNKLKKKKWIKKSFSQTNQIKSNFDLVKGFIESRVSTRWVYGRRWKDYFRDILRLS